MKVTDLIESRDYSKFILKYFDYAKKKSKNENRIIRDLVFNNKKYIKTLSIGDKTFPVILDMKILYGDNPKVKVEERIIKSINGDIANIEDGPYKQFYLYLCYPEKNDAELASLIYFLTSNLEGFNINAKTKRSIDNHKKAVKSLNKICVLNSNLINQLEKKIK